MRISLLSTNDCGKDGYTVKKLIALFLAVAFVCGTIGCGSPTTPAKTGTTTPPAGTPEKK